MINAGIFAWLLLKFFKVEFPGGFFYSFIYSLAVVGGVILLKHVLLALISYIFPVQKELSLYNFTIITFGIMLSLFLVPANTAIAYSTGETATYLVYGSIGALLVFFLFRSLRGLFIANQYLRFHKFHFLLYICTVEIAPILVLVKLFLIES